jgi:hypothetical protein
MRPVRDRLVRRTALLHALSAGGDVSTAVQPVGKQPAPGADTALPKRQLLLMEHNQLISDRQSIFTLWKDMNKYVYPSRGRFLTSDRVKLDRRSKDSLDITAMLAARTLASGMATGVTNAAREWFRITTPDPALAEFRRVKTWLQTVTDGMRGVMLGSNYYKAMHTMYGDMGGYGTSPVLVEEDEKSIIRCINIPVGSYCIANDGSGRVNVFSREWQMSTRQLVTTYGFDHLPETVRSTWRGGQTQAWHDVVHIIYPNPEYDVHQMHAKYKPWASCTFLKSCPVDETQFLRESGYDEFPLLTGRWDTTAEDAYATDCPGFLALSDIKMLQHGEKRALQALDKSVTPPLVAHSSLQNSAISQLPGGVTFDDGDEKRGLRPLHEVDPRLDKVEAKQAQVRNRILEAFYADLFRMNSYLDERRGSRQFPTAAEIGERREEKLLQLGPMLNNLDDDVYGPGIDRIFAIMVRRGLVPPAPPELAGETLKVEYLSIMHQAQKSATLGSKERFAAFATQLVQATEDPSIMDKVNTDELLESYADDAGVPPQTVRSDDEVAGIRQQRAQAAQRAQQAEVAEKEASAANKLAGANMDGDNALTRVVGALATQRAPGNAVGAQ